jgi:hypothetical protein
MTAAATTTNRRPRRTRAAASLVQTGLIYYSPWCILIRACPQIVRQTNQTAGLPAPSRRPLISLAALAGAIVAAWRHTCFCLFWLLPLSLPLSIPERVWLRMRRKANLVSSRCVPTRQRFICGSNPLREMRCTAKGSRGILRLWRCLAPSGLDRNEGVSPF